MSKPRSKINEICKNAELSVAEARALADRLKADRDKLEATVAELRAKVESSPEEREKLKAELRAEIAKDNAKEAKQAEKRAKEQEAELKDFERINSQLQAERDKQAEAMRELKEELVEVRRQAKHAEGLNRELIASRRECSELTSELEKLRTIAEAVVAPVASDPVAPVAPVVVEVQSPELLAELESLRSVVASLRSSASGQAVKLENVLRSRRLLREQVIKQIEFIESSGLVSPVSREEVESASVHARCNRERCAN